MSEDTSIEAMRETIETEYRSNIRQLDEHGDLFQKVLDHLPTGAVNRITYSDNSLTMSVNGSKHVLIATVRCFRTHGFKTGHDAPKENSPNWYAFFNHPSRAKIFLSFSSTSCRRVKVGTQTVQQDLYEVVCNEVNFDEPAQATQ